MVNFIAISEKSVINLDHVTAINAYSEKSDIEVFLLNGSSLTFEEDTAGQFLWNFDESFFENAPKLKEIRDSFTPDFLLEVKLRLGEEDLEIEVLDQVINNNQILGLAVENRSLKIIMGDYNTLRINHPGVIWQFLDNFHPDSLPEAVKSYYDELGKTFENLEEDCSPY